MYITGEQAIEQMQDMLECLDDIEDVAQAYSAIMRPAILAPIQDEHSAWPYVLVMDEED